MEDKQGLERALERVLDFDEAGERLPAYFDELRLALSHMEIADDLLAPLQEQADALRRLKASLQTAWEKEPKTDARLLHAEVLRAVTSHLIHQGVDSDTLDLLGELGSALTDLLAGAQSPLFSRVATRGRPQRPWRESYRWVQAAAVVRILMDAHGISKDEACKRVAAKLGVSAKQVRQRYDKIANDVWGVDWGKFFREEVSFFDKLGDDERTEFVAASLNRLRPIDFIFEADDARIED